jgi:hypothetical protein
MNFLITGSKRNSRLSSFFINNEYPILPILIITIMGMLIRIYRIGAASFWFDEAVTADMIFATSIADFISRVRLHVAASPLDYVITWIVGQFTLNEGILRLPAAIWGTLSLPISFFLFKKLADKKIALFTMLLFALSPLHVRFSQELRFYSSLVFFYLLSTYLLFDAFDTPQQKKWIVCTLMTIIGIFFHVFVILVIVNGLIWVIFNFKKIETASKRFFLYYLTFCLLGFLADYFLFAGYHSYEKISLFDFSPLGSTLGIGLGWLPLHPTQTWLPYLWGGFCCLFEIMGIIYLTTKKFTSRPSTLIYSIILQILLITFMGIYRGYSLAPRQFLMFLPFLLFFGTTGLFYVIDMFIHTKHQIFGRIATAAVLLCFCISSIPALTNYYQGIQAAKGFAREKSIYLASQWRYGDSLIFFPFYTPELYVYYLVEVMGRQDMRPFMWSADLNKQIDSFAGWKSKIFLIGSPTSKQADLLIKNGFYEDRFPGIWIRDAP